MDNSNDPLYSRGRPHPDIAGIPLRFNSSGAGPDEAQIAEAARVLTRPVKYIDADGYDQEIIAAAFGPSGEIAYVSCAAKELSEYVDVSFKFCLRDDSGREVSSEVASYNPYFGCDVFFLEWLGSKAVLIYQEKHKTYIAECSMESNARYVPITDHWIINNDRLGFWDYKDTEVRILELPALNELASMPEAQALDAGLRPEKFW